MQPDLCFVSHERRHIVGDRIEGAPDLVVEVLSPGSEFTDRGTKLRLYAENGVREYWLVNPAARSFQFLVNTGDQFAVTLAEDDVYTSTVIEGLTLDLVTFWDEVDRRIG